MTIQETPVLIERNRLQEIFSLNREKKVLFLSAAMGSGKTKVVEQWLEKEKEAEKIWFTFPEDTQDEQWVWFRLCQTMKKSSHTLGLILESVHLPLGSKEIDEFLILIEHHRVNDIPLYLMLDDYQECQSVAVKKVIKALCNHAFKNIYIIIMSREKPDAFFYEMELKRRCCILYQSDLDFSQQEIEDLWILNYKKITRDKRKLIYQYTEGWTASIYLMLLYDWNSKFPHHLKNAELLLRDHVYEKLSESWKLMLRKLALLESFTKQQALEITQNEAVVELIDYLERTNCFIHYNDSEKLYHLHTILRDMLSEMTMTKQQFCDDVYNLAGICFERQNEGIQALKYYGFAKNYPAILDLMSQQGSTEYMDIAPTLVNQLFENIPIDVAILNPLAYLAYISSYSIIENRNKGNGLLQNFKAYVSQSKMMDDPILKGELLLTESQVCFNKIDQMCKLQKKAEEYLGERGSSIYGESMDFLMGSPDVLFMYYRERESLNKLISTIISSSYHFVKLCHGCGSGCDKLAEAQMLMWQGHFNNQNLERLLHDAETAAREYNQTSILIGIAHTRLKKAVLTGDVLTCKKEEQNLKEYKTISKVPSQEASADMSLAYSFILKNDFENIPTWISKGQVNYYHTPPVSSAMAFIVYGFVLLHEERFEELAELTNKMIEESKKECLYSLRIYAQIFSSIVAESSAKEELLLQAINMAIPDRYWLPFIEFSPYILKTLKKITRRKELLQLCEMANRVFQKESAQLEKVNLTQREKEIMQSLCNGYTRLMIAEKLCISEYTVKRHISNIYDKLKVKSKAEAIKKMRMES